MKKRVVSAVLALALCLSLLPAAALAADTFPKDLCTQKEWEVLIETNLERLKEGRTPLSMPSGLQDAAGIREAEVVELYSHTRPNGTACTTVLSEKSVAYSMAGENIAYGFNSAKSVVDAWMNSSGHRANILNSGYTHIGIGSQSGRWVQLFVGDGRCAVSQLSLSRTSVNCPAGSGINDLGLYLTAQCPVHGTCCIPVLEGMCTGFDASAAGIQTVTVSYGGQTAQFQTWNNPFPDVPTGEYFAEPVAWAVSKGIVNGRENGMFDPYGTCNNQEIIVMLWRAAGQPAVADKAPVAADDFAAAAVNWAYAQGMIDGTFDRYAACTRATAVNWIWKSHGAPAGGSSSFPDVPAQYAAPVAWAVAKGVTYGNDLGNFDPDGICSRAQIVTFLHRAK